MSNRNHLSGRANGGHTGTFIEAMITSYRIQNNAVKSCYIRNIIQENSAYSSKMNVVVMGIRAVGYSIRSYLTESPFECAIQM